jgi:hypothetical protein
MPYCKKMNFSIYVFPKYHTYWHGIGEWSRRKPSHLKFFFNYVGKAASWARNILVKLRGPQSRNCMNCVKAKFHCRVSNTLASSLTTKGNPQNALLFFSLKPIQIPYTTTRNGKIREEFWNKELVGDRDERWHSGMENAVSQVFDL